MKNPALLLGLILFCAPVLAQDASQDKMKACEADAAKKELKGEEHKAFMKDCLAAKTDAKGSKKAKTSQQEKMKKCSADAKAKKLKGDLRKKFMSDCLKKKKG